MTKIDQLESWLAQEAEVVTRLNAGAGPGVITPEQFAGKSGLEVMRAMLRGELPYPPIAKTLDFQLLEVDEGRALFQGTPGRRISTRWARSTAAGMRRCSIPLWAARCTR